jgi:hypothetical protein
MRIANASGLSMQPSPHPDPGTEAFREHYRSGVMPAGYSGWRHVMLVAVVGPSVIGIALWLASRSWQPSDFWVVPATLLIANIVEYLAHRGPMHHRIKGLTLLHLRHSSRHHRYFTTEAMCFESTRDFHAVLFPPVLLMFFGGIAALLGLLATLLLTPAGAALFFATSMGYYLLYEVLHFPYHVPPHWPVGHIPGVRWLTRLHRLHHDPRHMLERNFNLVFPLCDWVVGTFDSGGRESRQTLQEGAPSK